ncbi:MAG: MinD/ParA family ATP-binding protein [Janthinobacterium lividum]
MDQAEGLRRLLARRPLRVVAMLGAKQGAGATTAAINLAAALCHHGKRALVIDEHAVPAAGQSTLADVVTGRVSLESAFFSLDESHGAAVLAAPWPSLAHVPGEEQLAALDGGADLVLIDARVGDDGAFSPLAAMAHDLVVVMDADAASLTSAYALIKRLHLSHANQQFRLLFNRVAQPSDAQNVYQNLSGVATRYLGVSLTPAGVISRDRERIARAAALGVSVVSAFPAAPAAIDYRRIAADMLHWPWRPIAPRAAAAAAVAAASVTDRLGLRPSAMTDADNRMAGDRNRELLHQAGDEMERQTGRGTVFPLYEKALSRQGNPAHAV